jgi:hypothetical protein
MQGWVSSHEITPKINAKTTRSCLRLFFWLLGTWMDISEEAVRRRLAELGYSQLPDIVFQDFMAGRLAGAFVCLFAVSRSAI